MSARATAFFRLITQMMGKSALLLLAFWPALLSAHAEWKEASCLGVVDAQGRLELTLKFDVPSYLVGQTPKDAAIRALDELMSTPGRLAAAVPPGRAALLRDTRLEVDGRPVALRLEAFPEAAQIAATSASQGTADRYPVMLNARFTAELPGSAEKIVLRFPAVLGNVFVNLRKGMEYQTVMTATPAIPAELTLADPSATSTSNTAWTLFIDGFAHVIPSGWDHCLFMLAMFLGAGSLGQAMRRSVVFTLGHSLTLTAVALGFMGSPGAWIEPFIALTIGVSAWLAYRGTLVTKSAFVIPAAFGLVHGLGFAAAVTDSLQGWQAGDIFVILIGFNLGVEAAQALVIFAAAALIWSLDRAEADTLRWRRQLSLAIAVIGFAVCVKRLFELA
ncbi:MAG: hypothetical protein RIS38_803 [Verrucomicrobiota bacterium]|jgi:hypothetical protein